jgi:protein LTV1
MYVCTKTLIPQVYDDEEDGEAREVIALEETSKEDKWDCESIISTYSNLYNHPKMISEPRRIQVRNVSTRHRSKLSKFQLYETFILAKKLSDTFCPVHKTG